MRATAEYYRQQAKRSRDLAERVRHKEAKAHLLNVAEQYDRLAEEAER